MQKISPARSNSRILATADRGFSSVTLFVPGRDLHQIIRGKLGVVSLTGSRTVRSPKSATRSRRAAERFNVTGDDLEGASSASSRSDTAR
jgi:hypothetical protein